MNIKSLEKAQSTNKWVNLSVHERAQDHTAVSNAVEEMLIIVPIDAAE